MSFDTPVISILMPFYNAQETIEAAVRSILRQSYQNWELLLPDDGSKDRSLELALRIGDPRLIIWSDGKQKGLAARLNDCVARARGAFMARMDSDDICFPERLAAQMAFLHDHPETDLVGCSVVVFGEDGMAIGKRLVPESHEGIVANPASGFGLAHPTWLGRSEWFRKHHYDPTALRYEDFELLYRSHPTSRFANLPDLLYGYREPRNGFRKRLKTRIGRVRYFYQRRHTEGSEMFWNSAKHEWWKAGADAMIVLTSQRYASLKLQTQRMTAAETADWRQVLASATQSAASLAAVVR